MFDIVKVSADLVVQLSTVVTIEHCTLVYSVRLLLIGLSIAILTPAALVLAKVVAGVAERGRACRRRDFGM